MPEHEGDERRRRRIPDPADLFVRVTDVLVSGYERSSRRSKAGPVGATTPLRYAVKRNGAGGNMLLIAMSFAASVGLTRAFLEMTGYPQIATGELHIAHVLWGGLLLFLGAVIPLALLNAWVYPLAAILAGAGMGLFMDEVGKFITQSNDYFYAPAAPIIYLVFLISLWLYVRVGRPPTPDPRAVMYRALESLGELLDRDLDVRERSKLTARLHFVRRETEDEDVDRLAGKLLEFLGSDDLRVRPQPPTFSRRLRGGIAELEARWLPQTRLKSLLILGMAALGFLAVDNFAHLVLGSSDPAALQAKVLALLDEGGSPINCSAGAFFSWVGMEAGVGLALMGSLGLWLVGREGTGVRFGRRALLLYIGLINLLVFYFDQFSSIMLAGFQISLLAGLNHYQRKFLRT